jgi:hypothetical protein
MRTEHDQEAAAPPDRDRCSGCTGPYHEATGHCFTPRTRLCGPCAGRFWGWVLRHTKRRWTGVSFYDHAAARRDEG